jgi:hypothetical protein
MYILERVNLAFVWSLLAVNLMELNEVLKAIATVLAISISVLTLISNRTKYTNSIKSLFSFLSSRKGSRKS